MSDSGEPGRFAAALAQANAAVAEMAEQYVGWVTADLARLEAAVASIDPNNPAAGLKATHAVAHDIKGQGSTFNYQMITEIGALLCQYLKACGASGQYDPAVIDAHLRALRAILANKVQGDAGPLGQQILANLKSQAAPEQPPT